VTSKKLKLAKKNCCVAILPNEKHTLVLLLPSI